MLIIFHSERGWTTTTSESSLTQNTWQFSDQPTPNNFTGQLTPIISSCSHQSLAVSLVWFWPDLGHQSLSEAPLTNLPFSQARCKAPLSVLCLQGTPGASKLCKLLCLTGRVSCPRVRPKDKNNWIVFISAWRQTSRPGSSSRSWRPIPSLKLSATPRRSAMTTPRGSGGSCRSASSPAVTRLPGVWFRWASADIYLKWC